MQYEQSRERHRTEVDVRDEIAYFEARLSEMGMGGDCAYERALTRAFHSLLEERKNMLARMHDQQNQRRSCG